ncbi:MAG: hypothetical protein JNL11_08235 [Bdellovibrionaceae bacterium]|nr:hypothetical protein [Pseudobdellovibrionaceae bacterium]
MFVCKYPLISVFQLINNGHVVFIAASRSVDEVIKVFPKKDRTQAEYYILSEILNLTDSDFHNRAAQWGEVLDIYGKRIDGINWYIKFFIEKDENGQDSLSEVSFHPLVEDMVLANGTKLKKEDP